MRFPTSSIPALPTLSLTDEEKALMAALQRHAERDRAAIQLEQAFYLGCYVIDNLRIAIPKELEFLRVLLGWPAMAVDPYAERLNADGFLVGDGTDSDQRISELLDASGFAAEQSLAYVDALSMRRAYWMVGSNPEKGEPPLVTVESPLNMSVLWDLRGRVARAAVQDYWDENDSTRKRQALVLPGKTIHLAENDKGEWEVAERDEHGFDFVPVVRMANQPTTNNRDGRSAITGPIQAITAAACRRLLGLEVASELYSVPQMILLGASEDAFQKSDGTPKSAWETYITKVLALERDADGQVPEVKQKTTYDPATFTKILDWYASSMSGMVAAPPQELGLYTQGNPTSAEAGIVADDRRNRRSRMLQRQFGVDLVSMVKMVLRFENKGTLPAEFRNLSADWAPVTMPPVDSHDGITKLIQAGAIPATSDVTLKRAGFNAVERRRLEQDRSADDGRNLGRALAAALAPSQQPVTAPAQEPTSGDAAGI